MSALALKEMPSPSLAPCDAQIDLDHLARMTLGDRSLEREVLALFARQAEILLQRMDVENPALAAASAHTIKGSSLGIGAWHVARAAEAVEHASASQLATAIAALGVAIGQARTAVAGLLQTH